MFILSDIEFHYKNRALLLAIRNYLYGNQNLPGYRNLYLETLVRHEDYPNSKEIIRGRPFDFPELSGDALRDFQGFLETLIPEFGDDARRLYEKAMDIVPLDFLTIPL